MQKVLLMSVLVLFLVGTLAAQQGKETAGVMCKLTGKKVEKCCCETRDGNLYCPLAKKEIKECCCETESVGKEKAAKPDCCQKGKNGKGKNNSEPAKPAHKH
jgi:hypothetical protein